MESNLVEAFGFLERLPGVEVHRQVDLVWFATGIPHPQFNGVVRTQLATGDVDTRIDDVISHFESRGLPMVWLSGPLTRPADLGERLEAHGLRHAGESIGMSVRLETLDGSLLRAQEIVIKRVRDDETLRSYLHAFTLGSDFPVVVAEGLFDLFSTLGFEENLPWRHYAGFKDGEPVASASIFLGREAAGVFDVATVSSARGQGIGTAMTLRALLDARDAGHRLGVLTSSTMGLGVYKRLGFEEFGRIGRYVWVGGRT